MDGLQLSERLNGRVFKWLVTGAAGFIGSHIVEKLLKLDQRVIGLDNLATGKLENLDEIRTLFSDEKWSNFEFLEGDIRDMSTCLLAARSVDYVLHQAALGSVPLSIEDPLKTHDVNVSGFLNILMASSQANVKRLVYASSCAIYGNNENSPLSENELFSPLSPYAASKAANEIYAKSFQKSFGLSSIGLRYFNVFGERQDPNGAYAAVIPKWIDAIISGSTPMVYGDGSSTRDFIYVRSVADVNIMMALCDASPDISALNVASENSLSMNELFHSINSKISDLGLTPCPKPLFLEPRKGDIRHSLGSSNLLREISGILLSNQIELGLASTVDWFSARSKNRLK